MVNPSQASDASKTGTQNSQMNNGQSSYKQDLSKLSDRDLQEVIKRGWETVPKNDPFYAAIVDEMLRRGNAGGGNAGGGNAGGGNAGGGNAGGGNAGGGSQEVITQPPAGEETRQIAPEPDPVTVSEVIGTGETAAPPVTAEVTTETITPEPVKFTEWSQAANPFKNLGENYSYFTDEVWDNMTDREKNYSAELALGDFRLFAPISDDKATRQFLKGDEGLNKYFRGGDFENIWDYIDTHHGHRSEEYKQLLWQHEFNQILQSEKLQIKKESGGYNRGLNLGGNDPEWSTARYNRKFELYAFTLGDATASKKEKELAKNFMTAHGKYEKYYQEYGVDLRFKSYGRDNRANSDNTSYYTKIFRFQEKEYERFNSVRQQRIAASQQNTLATAAILRVLPVTAYASTTQADISSSLAAGESDASIINRISIQEATNQETMYDGISRSGSEPAPVLLPTAPAETLTAQIAAPDESLTENVLGPEKETAAPPAAITQEKITEMFTLAAQRGGLAENTLGSSIGGGVWLDEAGNETNASNHIQNYLAAHTAPPVYLEVHGPPAPTAGTTPAWSSISHMVATQTPPPVPEISPVGDFLTGGKRDGSIFGLPLNYATPEYEKGAQGFAGGLLTFVHDPTLIFHTAAGGVTSGNVDGALKSGSDYYTQYYPGSGLDYIFQGTMSLFHPDPEVRKSSEYALREKYDPTKKTYSWLVGASFGEAIALTASSGAFSLLSKAIGVGSKAIKAGSAAATPPTVPKPPAITQAPKPPAGAGVNANPPPTIPAGIPTPSPIRPAPPVFMNTPAPLGRALNNPVVRLGTSGDNYLNSAVNAGARLTDDLGSNAPKPPPINISGGGGGGFSSTTISLGRGTGQFVDPSAGLSGLLSGGSRGGGGNAGGGRPGSQAGGDIPEGYKAIKGSDGQITLQKLDDLFDMQKSKQQAVQKKKTQKELEQEQAAAQKKKQEQEAAAAEAERKKTLTGTDTAQDILFGPPRTGAGSAAGQAGDVIISPGTATPPGTKPPGLGTQTEQVLGTIAPPAGLGSKGDNQIGIIVTTPPPMQGLGTKQGEITTPITGTGQGSILGEVVTPKPPMLGSGEGQAGGFITGTGITETGGAHVPRPIWQPPPQIFEDPPPIIPKIIDIPTPKPEPPPPGPRPIPFIPPITGGGLVKRPWIGTPPLFYDDPHTARMRRAKKNRGKTKKKFTGNTFLDNFGGFVKGRSEINYGKVKPQKKIKHSLNFKPYSQKF